MTVRQLKVSPCYSLLTFLCINVRVYTTYRCWLFAVHCSVDTAAGSEDQPESGPSEIQLRVTIGDETIGLGDVTVQVYMHTYIHEHSIYTL
jgi:hypothetical protein